MLVSTGIPVVRKVSKASMKILSVNDSFPREITHNGKAVTTSIFKEPVNLRHLYVPADRRRGRLS